MGTLIQKHQRHPGPSVKNPPRRGPTTDERANMPAIGPIQAARVVAGVMSARMILQCQRDARDRVKTLVTGVATMIHPHLAGNLSWPTHMLQANMPPPPIPWTARSTIKLIMLLDKAQPIEPMMKLLMVKMMTDRRPKMSAKRPTSGVMLV